jgi:hypothetical protein
MDKMNPMYKRITGFQIRLHRIFGNEGSKRFPDFSIGKKNGEVLNEIIIFTFGNRIGL